MLDLNQVLRTSRTILSASQEHLYPCCGNPRTEPRKGWGLQAHMVLFYSFLFDLKSRIRNSTEATLCDESEDFKTFFFVKKVTKESEPKNRRLILKCSQGRVLLSG
jgi:hypothetical protein